jgi:acyl-CoA synthetase (NDP forming)
MIQEIRGAPLLQGYRGTPPVALHALEDMLLKLSTLAERRSDVSEVDVNPILAYPEGALAVDARILLA